MSLSSTCRFLDYLQAVDPRQPHNKLLTIDAPPGAGSSTQNDQSVISRLALTVATNHTLNAVIVESPSPSAASTKETRRTTKGRLRENPDSPGVRRGLHDARQAKAAEFQEPTQGSKDSKGSKAVSQGSNDMFLRVDEMVEEYASEAEMSGLDDYYREEGHAKRTFRRLGRSRGGGGGGSDSDESGGEDGGGGGGRGGERAEVYDSDLESTIGDVGQAAHKKKMRRYKALARDHFERMLLECIVNTESIKDNYEDMFVDQKTIDKLEHATRMSLLRPKAFNRGVLAGNRVTGAVLYGPPGTGKTLLVKGLARKSGFNMILASTAELWQKCHGDDEKVIKALFSMGRKLHPAIVFIDEADGLLGVRKAGEKRHIRAMLNQFLMEWDGLNSGKDAPFILLATNRPFDLDPAVLRRAPVRIHLDVPTAAQRFGILGLLLKDEVLGADVSVDRLAKMTTRYTGSDLKNLCVTAATSAVSEQAEDSEHRVLRLRHFQTAMISIKATGLSKTVENEFQNFERGANQGARAHDED
ncbi:unnamed protein product [Parascedosporium putredinis]|uniref:AAA+ ATPase domain-containing protein n=1 Tax=Parascedosporium putredinis TaxID=1442378 RepID=A0A9P1H1R9_9PEZI|nr:unnamed protein product [Parascedosporium putredinis]CAI7993006.1 unnamed protein product [Parascedosporium putredinis]